MAEKQSPDEILTHLRSLDAKWLRIYWVDATASSKCRLVPMKRVWALGLLPCDMLAPGVSATHTYNLHPGWSSLRRGPVEGHVSCYGEFRQIDGSDCVLCPRRLLRRTVEQAAASGPDFLIGFEIEFVALEKVPRNDQAAAAAEGDGPKYRTIAHDGHSWSASRALAEWGRQDSIATVLDEMVDLLAHLPVLAAFTYANPGELRARRRQRRLGRRPNRETPLRKCAGSHWEFKALGFLAADEMLEGLVGREFVRRYVDVKRAELAFLMPMADDERRQWLVERY
ncbi:uncharacterized protein PG986_003366 [Apiospora aurea]|uniref:GS catalytic domain-containing protein n=1 Tax=Apiospora aurea TaxID=335848 RepID=A0ABR1QRH2_9PEZI